MAHPLSLTAFFVFSGSLWYSNGRPPPNQIVLVTPAHPYKMAEAYQPVSVTGVLKPGLEKSQLFILDGVSIVQSGYTVRTAEVVNVENVPDAVTLPVNSPWNFLNKKKN